MISQVVTDSLACEYSEDKNKPVQVEKRRKFSMELHSFIYNKSMFILAVKDEVGSFSRRCVLFRSAQLTFRFFYTSSKLITTIVEPLSAGFMTILLLATHLRSVHRTNLSGFVNLSWILLVCL